MSRRNGRILAVQALYSYDVGKMPLEELLKLEWIQNESDNIVPEELKEGLEAEAAGSDTKAEEYDFARLLIAGTINHIDEIDEKIKAHLSGKWDFNRLNKVTLAVIRISVFAILYQKDLNPTIVIDEAIGISKDFGTDDSFKFINAILDTIRKEEEKA
ncbi:transcription antitermination factor NusB [Treponema sp.]|uniref:transcription antitermination factor NusB n=1 Tax=Treponema sp. TaxID=166 RepID=UPI00388D628D